MNQRRALVPGVLVPGVTVLVAIKGQESKLKRQALPPVETTVAE